MDENKRIPIINTELCQSKKCKQECPVVMGGKICIDVKPTYKQAIISETLCIGCGICVKQCPFKAIKIINLPTRLVNCMSGFDDNVSIQISDNEQMSNISKVLYEKYRTNIEDYKKELRKEFEE